MKIIILAIKKQKVVFKKHSGYILVALCFSMLTSFACKKTNLLYPLVDEPMPSIIDKPDPPVQTKPSHDPTFATNWGDTIKVPSIATGEFLITDFGASTSSSDNAGAIQKAIDAAAKAGGGSVIIPAGTFISGPLLLKSNIGLKISEGAVLKVLDYTSYPGSGTTAKVASFLDLSGTTNVLISGKGIIDGQGDAWWAAFRATKPNGGIGRPAIISFDDASIIEVQGITIQNAPNGHISIHRGNKHVTIAGVTINSPADSPNTDGIDVWSPLVNILDCHISCGDDNIAMDNETRYMTIKNCTFGSGHGLSIGSYTSGIDHIYVSDCVFDQTDNGVHIKSSRDRSGLVEDLVYENLTMTGVSTPINICEYYPDNTIPSSGNADKAEPVTASTPTWQHIFLKDIKATGADNAGLLWAVPEMPIKDIVFDNVQIEAKTGMRANYLGDCFFINGSSIKVGSGKAITSAYGSSITGIDQTTGTPTE